LPYNEILANPPLPIFSTSYTQNNETSCKQTQPLGCIHDEKTLQSWTISVKPSLYHLLNHNFAVNKREQLLPRLVLKHTCASTAARHPKFRIPSGGQFSLRFRRDSGPVRPPRSLITGKTCEKMAIFEKLAEKRPKVR